MNIVAGTCAASWYLRAGNGRDRAAGVATVMRGAPPPPARAIRWIYIPPADTSKKLKKKIIDNGDIIV